MERSTLVRFFGFPAALVHGDTLVLDRWLWLKRRLPVTANGETLIDVGCGTGVFSIGAAKRGYKALGLSWDEANQTEAQKRATICRADASFEVCDARCLDEFEEFRGRFDVALCFEIAEHILDDRKLLQDVSACLKPGGRILLTTPNYYYRPISLSDNGPFEIVENGWHVRRGYTPAMLQELCVSSDLICEEISYCSGFFSQKLTRLIRWAHQRNGRAGWVLTLPLRLFAWFFDFLTFKFSSYPGFSICLVAQKPRFTGEKRERRPMSPSDSGPASFPGADLSMSNVVRDSRRDGKQSAEENLASVA